MVYFDREHEHRRSQNRFVVAPTALRLGVEPDRTARGVTLAFLDSVFYPHPDLTHRKPYRSLLGYLASAPTIYSNKSRAGLLERKGLALSICGNAMASASRCDTCQLDR